MIKFGVIGYGYWGPNVVRNLDRTDGCKVVAICDKTPASRKAAQKAYPAVTVTSHSEELLTSTEIDAIAVITPVWTHYELAKAALEHGKHVFVEKPFTSNGAQAEELINLAAKKKLKIMVDHTFLFTGAVKKIRQVLKEGTLGNIYYYDSTRVNLGLFQHDVNVLWDLAPHDLSIIDHLITESPEAVSATGQTHLNLCSENRKQLEVAGVSPQNIEASGVCTFCDAERFFSYRREKEKAGRMTSFIRIGPEIKPR